MPITILIPKLLPQIVTSFRQALHLEACIIRIPLFNIFYEPLIEKPSVPPEELPWPLFDQEEPSVLTEESDAPSIETEKDTKPFMATGIKFSMDPPEKFEYFHHLESWLCVFEEYKLSFS